MKWSELCNWTPKQLEALEAIKTHRFIMYGGARGGGKSYLLRWWLLQSLLEWHAIGIDNVRVMLGCESYPVLLDRQVSKINIEFPRYLGEVKKTQEDGLGFFLKPEFGGGAILFRNLDEPEKYVGAEFAAVGIDQLEKVKINVFNVLRGSLRFPGIDEPKMVATSHPGGIGHRWVKSFWIDKIFPKELEPYADKFVFIKALPKDNSHLTDVYYEDLNTLPPNLREAWLEGNWDILSGSAFGQFNESHIVKPFDINPKWFKIRGVDWGYSQPFACVWLAKDPDLGRLYLYRTELHAGLTDRQQARLINEYTEPISITYADPSMWSPKSMANIVTSSADEYRHEGVYLTRGDNGRISGKRKIDRLLGLLPDGMPGLQVFENCKNFIDTFPYLIVDEDHPEDVDTEQDDDHLYDALRYGVSGIRPEEPERKKWRSPFADLKRI